jgi:hypothetical protein
MQHGRVQTDNPVAKPKEPGQYGPWGLAGALVALALFVMIDYFFSHAYTVQYLVIVVLIVVIVAIVLPPDMSRAVARVIALGLTILLVWLLWWSGLAFAAAEASSEVAQGLQDNDNSALAKIGNIVNGSWMIFMIVGVVVSGIWWFSKKPWLIVLSGLLLALALFPLVGIAGQVMIYDL